MKRVISTLLSVLIISTVSVGIAFDFDESTFGVDELKEIISESRAALREFDLIVKPNTVILDHQGVKITVVDIDTSGGGIYLKTLIENKSENTIAVYIEDSSINGWKTGYIDHTDKIPPGKKAKGEISAKPSYEGVLLAGSYNEIRDFEFFFFVAKFPDNKLESFFTTDILHLRFDE